MTDTALHVCTCVGFDSLLLTNFATNITKQFSNWNLIWNCIEELKQSENK